MNCTGHDLNFTLSLFPLVTVCIFHNLWAFVIVLNVCVIFIQTSLVIHYVYIHNMNIDVHVRLQITIRSIMPCFDASYSVEPLN